jgi:hypothetical protein
MIQFLDSVWLDVTVRGESARLLVREPNALEGVRYFSAIQKWRDRLESDEARWRWWATLQIFPRSLA